MESVAGAGGGAVSASSILSSQFVFIILTCVGVASSFAAGLFTGQEITEKLLELDAKTCPIDLSIYDMETLNAAFSGCNITGDGLVEVSGAACQVQCRNGTEFLTGNTSIVCDVGGEWNLMGTACGIPKVDPTKCSVDDLTSLNMVLTNDSVCEVTDGEVTVSDIECTVECINGTELLTSFDTMVCSAGGYWNPTANAVCAIPLDAEPTCSVDTLLFAGLSLTNDSQCIAVDGQVSVSTTECKVECADGTVLLNASVDTVMCLGGYWVNPTGIPQCGTITVAAVPKCPVERLPTDIALATDGAVFACIAVDGKVNGTGTDCEVECVGGLELVLNSSNTIKCTGEGEWDISNETQCRIPPACSVGQLEEFNMTLATDGAVSACIAVEGKVNATGTECKLECVLVGQEFVLNSSNTIRCIGEGDWEISGGTQCVTP
eukprot:759581_1